MAKSKILNRLRNNINALFKTVKNERVQDQIIGVFFLLTGISIALVLNNATPIFPSIIVFYVLLAVVFGIVVFAWLAGFFDLIRILLIGASIISVLSALVTFFIIGNRGFISITLDQIAGIFRSILLASFFSLLERATRFVEDRVKAKNQINS